jgi:hypothetical protein
VGQREDETAKTEWRPLKMSSFRLLHPLAAYPKTFYYSSSCPERLEFDDPIYFNSQG